MGKRYGWEAKAGESETAGVTRSMVLSRLALAGDEECVKKAVDMLKKNREVPIPKDLRSFVYRTALMNGPDECVDIVLDIYRNSSNTEEKLTALACLGYVKSEEQIKRISEWAISSGEVKTQDYLYFTTGAAACHFELMWSFFKDHWNKITETYAESSFMFGRVITSFISGCADSARIDEFRKYFADKDVSGAEKEIEHTYLSIQSKSRWLKQCREDKVVSWVTENC